MCTTYFLLPLRSISSSHSGELLRRWMWFVNKVFWCAICVVHVMLLWRVRKYRHHIVVAPFDMRTFCQHQTTTHYTAYMHMRPTLSLHTLRVASSGCVFEVHLLHSSNTGFACYTSFIYGGNHRATVTVTMINIPIVTFWIFWIFRYAFCIAFQTLWHIWPQHSAKLVFRLRSWTKNNYDDNKNVLITHIDHAE